MKTIIIPLAIVLISFSVFAQTNAPSATDWQKIVIGTDLKVDCPSKKMTSKGYDGCYLALDINVNAKNNQVNPASYKIDIVFLDRAKTNTLKEGEGIRARDKQSAQISLNAGASTNLSFRANDVYYGEKISVAWTGYIVRLSAHGKPIKIVASSKVLEKLAADPEKMKLLESGKIVSGK